jgi:hypothetical protein
VIVAGAALWLTAAAAAPGSATVVQDTSCIVMREESEPLVSRTSPLDSISFTVGRIPVKVCYSRPSTYGRTVLGGMMPYGMLWRTGDYEPTMIHTMGAINFAGIRLSAGSYSLYTRPGEGSWEVIVNRSVSQWGSESEYTEDLRMQEVGRVPVGAERSPRHVHLLTFTALPASDGVVLLMLEWEHARVTMPIMP